jgi:hypothetical protein
MLTLRLFGRMTVVLLDPFNPPDDQIGFAHEIRNEA